MRHPDCQFTAAECRITAGNATSTSLSYTMVVDGDGNHIDSGDPNIVMQDMRCATCRRKWKERTQYDQTEVCNTVLF